MSLSLSKRISFILITGLLSVLIIEGIIRLIPEKKQVVPPTINQFDERLGWALKPHSQATGWVGTEKIEYRINSKGLRDGEINYEKPAGTFRIVVIGDSNTFGYGVPIEKHFTSLLEGYFKDVEVINMGVNAYGVDQELIFLRLEGFRYKPDLVLAYVPHYEDHRHMHTYRFGSKKPRFILTEGKLVLTNYPVEDSFAHTSALRKTHWWFIKHSKAYTTLRNSIQYFINREKPELQKQKVEQQDKKSMKDENFEKELYTLGDELIHEMHIESIKHAAGFVLVTRMKRLHDVALKKQMISLDVSNSLNNSEFALPKPYGHINECGNGVLAYKIANFLQENNLIPQKYFITRLSDK